MRTKIPVLLTGMLFLFVIAGCSGNDPNRPPSIRYGKDVCSECRMIISEEQFASAVTEKGKDPLRFDSIGCMLKNISGQDSAGKSIWVHDFETHEWLQAENSSFVRNREIPTPMGDGLIAFHDFAAAQAEAGTIQGTVLKFNDLLNSVVARSEATKQSR